MRTYDILADFGLKDEEADRITLNAGCVVAIFRHRYPVTFSRKKGASFSNEVTRATELNGGPLIIVDDLANVQVSSTKSNHIDTLTGSLRPGLNYLAEAMPGDYVFCWMVQSQEAVASLTKRLLEGRQCNEFNDGLKFFGKLSGMRKRVQIQPQTGTKVTTFVFNATGFSEFDGSIYFEPFLQLKSVGLMADWLQKYGIKLNEIIARSGMGIGVNEILPALLQVFFGRGIPNNSGLSQGGPKITDGLDNPYSFVVPTEVAKVFGVSTGSKPHGLIAYTDMLEVVHGVQSYLDDVHIDANAVGGTVDFQEDDDRIPREGSLTRGKVFQPQGAGGNGKMHYTQDRQMGVFVPSVPATDGQRTAWNLINQFLNPAVNEIYTAMRTNAQGRVYPTLISRQLPFSSTAGLVSNSFVPKPFMAPSRIKKDAEVNVDGPIMRTFEKERVADFGTLDVSIGDFDTDKQPISVKLTRFLELPRWRIHPVFLKSFDIGRSDALRFNFINVQADAGGAKSGISVTGGFVRNPPVRDDLDVARSGLRPYMKTIPCAPADAVDRNPSAWMYVLSDILMGQHLTLTGNLESDGIQQPIVVGDNVEFDETVLHIEAVAHSFNSDGNGNRKFTTNLSLTHGVNAAQANDDDTSLYTGITSAQLTAYDPAIMRDSENQLPEPIKPVNRPDEKLEKK